MTKTLASEIARLRAAKCIYARDYDGMMAVIEAQEEQLAVAREALAGVTNCYGTISFSSHNQMREAIEDSIELAETALAATSPNQELPA